MNKNQSGYVLTIALFLIFAISVFALAAGGIVSSDLFATRKYESSMQAGFLARAGVEKALQVLKHDEPAFDSLNEEWRNGESSFKDVDINGGVFNVTYKIDGLEKYGIVDEESKVNINNASFDMLMSLPSLGEDETKKIIESRKRLLFQRPFELVSRGIISEDLFIGQDGLENLVTVWGDGKININTAPRHVLDAVPNLLQNEIDTIISYRRGSDGIQGTSDDGIFKSINDFTGLSGIRFEKPDSVFKVTSSNFFIVSEGTIRSKSPLKGKKIIEAVVQRNGTGLVIKHWNMI